jgi:hypothetical protein
LQAIALFTGSQHRSLLREKGLLMHDWQTYINKLHLVEPKVTRFTQNLLQPEVCTFINQTSPLEEKSGYKVNFEHIRKPFKFCENLV